MFNSVKSFISFLRIFLFVYYINNLCGDGLKSNIVLQELILLDKLFDAIGLFFLSGYNLGDAVS